MLQELSAHNMTNNITIMSSHCKGGPAIWPLDAEEPAGIHHAISDGQEAGISPSREEFPVREYQKMDF